MSHPVPGHDYGEQTERESDKDYARRRSGHTKLNPTQKMTGKWLKEAGETIKQDKESHLHHLKRLMQNKAKTKALKKSMSGSFVSKPTGVKNFHKQFPEPKGHSDMSGTSGSEDR